MVGKLLMSAVVCAAMLVGVAPAASADTTVPLLVSQSAAFSVLGHSCGGIQEQALTTGFNAKNGYPKGVVYLQTKCGGSGRGGGYHTTTYSAWVRVAWDFTGAVRSYKASAAPAKLDPTFSATDARGDQVYNVLNAVNVLPANCTVGNTTYCSYRAYLTVPVPGAPTAVTASQTGDALNVSWTAPNAPITTSTVTATPTTGDPLSATVTGSATAVAIDGVAPSTEYSITVTSTDAGGTGDPSIPVTFTTNPATAPPSAPTGLVVSWSPDGASLQARWTAAVPGDSPVDDYQVAIARHDPNGPPTVLDAGAATSFSTTAFNNVPDWSVQVQAHNAAGFGPWSAPVILPGL